MVEFIIGLNTPTILVLICIAILVALSGLIGYFIQKRACDKKPKCIDKKPEMMIWDSTNYNKLKDKIRDRIKVVLAEKIENYQDSPDSPDSPESIESKIFPDLLDCVTNRFTLQYNNPALIEDSDFDARVKEIIIYCKDKMQKRMTNPDDHDPDPGAPIWTDDIVNKFTNLMKMSLSKAPTQPNTNELSCIVNKVKSRITPRNMMAQKSEETINFLNKIFEECNYKQKFPTNYMSDSKIDFKNSENVKKLKDLIKSLGYSLDTDNSLVECIASKIIQRYDNNDPEVTTDIIKNEDKSKLLVNKIAEECTRNAPPTVAQPTVAQPTVAQPTVAPPTVAPPTVARQNKSDTWDSVSLSILNHILGKSYKMSDFLITCLAKQISMEYDSSIVKAKSFPEIKSLVAPLSIINCGGTLWKKDELEAIIPLFFNILTTKLNARPTMTYLNCFLINIMLQFASYDKLQEHIRTADLTYIDEIMESCK
jgi:flagellin-specific chaperone FliS